MKLVYQKIYFDNESRQINRLTFPPMPINHDLIEEKELELESDFLSWACWSSYKVEWEVVEDKLYLNKVSGTRYEKKCDEPIFASWVTKDLVIENCKTVKIKERNAYGNTGLYATLTTNFATIKVEEGVIKSTSYSDEIISEKDFINDQIKKNNAKVKSSVFSVVHSSKRRKNTKSKKHLDRDTHCYNCKVSLSTKKHKECKKCGWIICPDCYSCNCG